MKTLNALAAIVASAGTAVSALGQVNGTFVIDVRLVVDGDLAAPSGPGIDQFLPGPNASRVGLTLQARVTQTIAGTNTGSGNYGIGGLGPKGLAVADAANFTHNDASSIGGGYYALARGQTGTAIGGDGLPVAGFFDGQNNPTDGDASGAAREFRAGITGTTADVNSLRGNPAGYTNGASAAGNGVFLDYFPGMVYMSSSVKLAQQSDPVRYAVGEPSPWYNLYRLYFEPRSDGSAAQRQVTVTFDGKVSAVVRTAPFILGGRALTIGGGSGSLIVTGLAATFTVGAVPAPTVGAVLVLGGLLAARRRRQV